MYMYKCSTLTFMFMLGILANKTHQCFYMIFLTENIDFGSYSKILCKK
jgi:hypothetical protein